MELALSRQQVLLGRSGGHAHDENGAAPGCSRASRSSSHASSATLSPCIFWGSVVQNLVTSNCMFMNFENVARSTIVFVVMLAMSVSTVSVASAEVLTPREPIPAPAPGAGTVELLPPPKVQTPELLPPPKEVPRGPVKVKADDPRVREILTRQFKDLEEKIPSIKDPRLQQLAWEGFLARLQRWYSVNCDAKTGEAKNRNPVTTANCAAVKELIRQVQGKISWLQGVIDKRVAMVTPLPVPTTVVSTSSNTSDAQVLASIMSEIDLVL